MEQQKKNKPIGKYLILSTIILFLVLILTMKNINTFMEVLTTCVDDFAIIEKCGCVPW